MSVSLPIEDAFKGLLAAVPGVTPYTTAEAVSAMAEDRIEIMAGDADLEFPDASPDSQAAANVVVPVTLTVQTNVVPTDAGGVDADTARIKHDTTLRAVTNEVLIEGLATALNNQHIAGLFVGMAYVNGVSRPVAERGRYRSDIPVMVHACAV
jgi:hypothetical protein